MKKLPFPRHTATRYSLVLALVWCSLFLPSFSFTATDQTADAGKPASRERHWTVTIPLWIPGYRGEFAIGDIDVSGESSGGSGLFDRFFDSELKLNFFFMGALTYERARWHIHADGFGGHFTDDVIFTLTDGTVVSADVQPVVPGLRAGYRVLQHRWGDSDHRQIQMSVYGGVRYYDVRIEVEVLDNKRNITANWVDPIVGIWMPIEVSRRWVFEASADIGGFSIGSDLSWRVLGVASYRASDLVSLSLGYNVLDVEYESTVSGEDFLYRVRLGGPLASIRFTF